MDLEGRVAVVTGGASGMGEALVGLLRAAGARAVVWDLAAGADVECDVSDPDAVDAAIEVTVRREGVPTVVTACAGIGTSGALVDVSPETWDRVMG